MFKKDDFIYCHNNPDRIFRVLKYDPGQGIITALVVNGTQKVGEVVELKWPEHYRKQDLVE